MIMTLRIPLKDSIKTYDEMCDIGTHFSVDIDKDANDIVLNGDKDELLDFLTAYHDVDMQAAKESFSKYAIKTVTKQHYTPESALQKLNEFVMSKGGFDDYDEVFEALNNAIHGLE